LFLAPCEKGQGDRRTIVDLNQHFTTVTFSLLNTCLFGSTNRHAVLRPRIQYIPPAKKAKHHLPAPGQHAQAGF
jgi:hypothetical protein